MRIETREVSVLCECGGEHRLFKGITAPCYWCEEELREIKTGDYVDYKEVKNE